MSIVVAPETPSIAASLSLELLVVLGGRETLYRYVHICSYKHSLLYRHRCRLLPIPLHHSVLEARQRRRRHHQLVFILISSPCSLSSTASGAPSFGRHGCGVGDWRNWHLPFSTLCAVAVSMETVLSTITSTAVKDWQIEHHLGAPCSILPTAPVAFKDKLAEEDELCGEFR